MQVFFNDKVIWITGASSGIGEEAAKQLYAKGGKLVLSARSAEKLHALKNRLSTGDDILVLPLDLTQPHTFAEAVNQVMAHFGRVDILFNNAGVSQRSFVEETDVVVDRRLMEINYFGTIGLTKLVLPQMLKNGSGHFAVVTSIVGKFGFPVRSAYAASKHALHGFFESLYMELNKKGIGVTIIAPGPIQTNISMHALDGSGNPTGEMDAMQENGMPVNEAVSKMLKAIANKKPELILGGFKEKLGVKLKALLPGLFYKMASNQNPRGEL